MRGVFVRPVDAFDLISAARETVHGLVDVALGVLGAEERMVERSHLVLPVRDTD
jgi:hypothetical protein